MNRYFFSRRKGEYWIMDRTLDTRIAKTDWRESAVLICQALNFDADVKIAASKLPPCADMPIRPKAQVELQHVDPRREGVG